MFIKAFFKFIRIMVIGLVKGIPGMLGLYYKDNGNGSKQPINL